MSRLPPTCACSCGQPSISCGRISATCAGVFTGACRTGGRGSAMPAYTHLQRAEPVLVAHWMMAYVEMFLRDADRLADCRKRVEPLPVWDRGRLPAPRCRSIAASWLMNSVLTRPPPTALTPPADRDFVVEFVNAAVVAGAHLSRWAEEMILFSTQEFGFLQLARGLFHGQQRYAAEKESRPVGTGARQGRACDRKCNRADDCAQRPAPRLQQRPAGNARAALRLRRHNIRAAAARYRMDESSGVQSRPR